MYFRKTVCENGSANERRTKVELKMDTENLMTIFEQYSDNDHDPEGSSVAEIQPYLSRKVY